MPAAALHGPIHGPIHSLLLSDLARSISPWVAMSLLQKALRRGCKDPALRAAATLLIAAPDKLWRRLGCIAFEDIGVGDLDAVALVTGSDGGETITFRATKCRAADDLLLAAASGEDEPTWGPLFSASSSDILDQ
jgi:hypothetical protein